jgi:hypothetical protein
MVTIDSLSTSTTRSVFDAVVITSGGAIEEREETREVIRSGFRAVDALMPSGGIRSGSLVEWIARGDGEGVAGGAGAVSLAFAIACQIAKAAAGTSSGPRTILVVDRGGWFYPPAVLPWLDDSRQLVVARPSHDDDEIWAIDQALRCSGVAAVVAWPRGVASHGSLRGGRSARRPGFQQESSRPLSSWTTAMRRWQLSARSSGCIGLFIRPAATAHEPSWAEAKIAVSPLCGASSLIGASSLPVNSLHERRLRLERIGGAWNGGLTGKVTEAVLDLARGSEGVISHEAVRSLPIPRRREAATRSPRAMKRGVVCRAS